MLSVAFKPFMLSVIVLNVVMQRVKFTECHIEALYAERHYAECRYAERHYAECRYAGCRSAEQNGLTYS